MKELGTITLETERLTLRRFKLEDAKEMYNNWATDSECNKFLSWDLHKNIEETKTIISNWIKEYETGSYNWVVELKETKEIIGSICAVHIRKKDKNVELGYCFGSKYWNKGYATETLKRIINFFLIECEFNLVEAKHISGNPTSGRVMEKSGMKKEAVLKERRLNKHTKELNDSIIYSITKKELNEKNKII